MMGLGSGLQNGYELNKTNWAAKFGGVCAQQFKVWVFSMKKHWQRGALNPESMAATLGSLITFDRAPKYLTALGKRPFLQVRRANDAGAFAIDVYSDNLIP